MSEQVLDSFQKLINVISTKETIRLSYQFNDSDSTVYFDQPLMLNPDRNYQFYMKQFYVYNTLFNVDETNNKFVYTTNDGSTWKTLTIPPGGYDIKVLNTEIQTMMKNNGDYNTTTNEPYITLEANEATSKTLMKIRNSNYAVDFSVANSINKILGFNSNIYLDRTEVYISENIIQITLTNTIFIHCDWVTASSYHNGKAVSVLYTIAAYSVPVGAKLLVSEVFPIMIPLNRKSLSSIRFQIKDDKGKLLNFNKEDINIEIIINQI